ncbi:MAG: hypothetical protein CK528_10100 [Alcaligenaceae bacterium]|nr:MAG: hypothetical protein CK528_10100 [Alcaligenaceae bacterium]
MARLSRLYAPAAAHLVLARFASSAGLGDHDSAARIYPLLLNWLGQSAQQYQVAVHGWCLSPQVLLVLATPADALGLPCLIQDLGRRLAAQLKRGSVFSGRYHSAIPEPGEWVLPSLIWLERAAMREDLVSEPAQWLWSSARAHAEGLDTRASWLQHHRDYWQCGNTPFGRQASYREHLNTGNTFAQDQAIEAALKGQWGLGGAEFLADLSVEAGRRAQPGLRGRPKREAGIAKKLLQQAGGKA